MGLVLSMGLVVTRDRSICIRLVFGHMNTPISGWKYHNLSSLKEDTDIKLIFAPFQGGCGEASSWGGSQVHHVTKCTVSVKGNVEVKGECTKGGHCKGEGVWSFGHNQCTRGNVRIL